MTMTPFAAIVRSLLAVPFAASLLAAQQARDFGPALAGRERLSAELGRLDIAGDAPARAQAALIRTRLRDGDFQVGDRIVIRVEGEPQLSDTFTVHDGPVLELPQVGTVALRGVLRSELVGALQSHLAQYLRNPVIQVRPLVRILVEGDVAHPGYYSAAPQQALADVITMAGGLSPRAKAGAMRVERGSERIWSGQPLQDAVGRGYSLDQLNLRAGDRVLVPTRGDAERTWRILGIAVTLPVAIYTMTRLF
jgi:protein involved in polysaccharide export with SLBB domain